MERFAEGKKPLSEAVVARGGDDLDHAPTIRTGRHINLKNPLEALSPAHRRPLLGRCAIFCWSRPQRLSAPASPGWRDPGPVRADRFSFNGFFRLCRKPPLTQTGADCWARIHAPRLRSLTACTSRKTCGRSRLRYESGSDSGAAAGPAQGFARVRFALGKKRFSEPVRCAHLTYARYVCAGAPAGQTRP